MPDLPVLDPATIETLRAISPDDQGEFLREITGIFQSDTPQRITELERSLAAGDAATFTRAAHSIKGSAANLGAAVLAATAAQLETRSREVPLSGLAPLIEQLKIDFARASAALQKLTA